MVSVPQSMHRRFLQTPSGPAEFDRIAGTTVRREAELRM
jgi:hypothetical protein